MRSLAVALQRRNGGGAAVAPSVARGLGGGAVPDATRGLSGGAVAVATALLVAGCGSTYTRADGPESKEIRRTSVAIDYASFYPPASDIKRLARARAAQRGVRLTFSTDMAGSAAQAKQLSTFTGASGGFGVAVVAPFDAPTVEPIAKAAIARGVKIVSYLEPLASQSAGITVDLAGGARDLVEHALQRQPGATPPTGKSILVVVAPATSPVPDPLAGAGRAASTAILAALRARGFGSAARVTAIGEADARSIVGAALRASPSINTVLTWNDTTGVGASEGSGEGVGQGKGRGRGIGGSAGRSNTGGKGASVDRSSARPTGGARSPAGVSALSVGGVSTAATLRVLQRGGSLDEIIAPRLRDLANALVDVPFAILSGTTASTPTLVPLQRFTRGAPATQAALADYGG